MVVQTLTLWSLLYCCLFTFSLISFPRRQIHLSLFLVFGVHTILLWWQTSIWMKVVRVLLAPWWVELRVSVSDWVCEQISWIEWLIKWVSEWSLFTYLTAGPHYALLQWCIGKSGKAVSVESCDCGVSVRNRRWRHMIVCEYVWGCGSQGVTCDVKVIVLLVCVHVYMCLLWNPCSRYLSPHTHVHVTYACRCEDMALLLSYGDAYIRN